MSRSLPQGFIDMLGAFSRPDITGPLIAALGDSEPSLAVRRNVRRGAAFAVDADSVPWLPGQAIYLDRRPNFALDPAWHQGLYYVQDASSMIITDVVKSLSDRCFDNKPLRYLDACAAPGGKSIAAAEALPVGSCILSNEYDPRRAAVLAENMAKYGMANVAVSQGDTARIARLGEIFDIVAVDAPCSGEGMMRKEPDAIAQWSTGLIDSCAALQREIIANAWKALRPGGVMIYSTCTFNRAEDEENVAFIADTLGAVSIDLGLDRYPGVFKGLETPHYCYRFMPGHVRGEGLFIAALQKPMADSREPRFKSKAPVKNPLAENFLANFISGDFSLRQDKAGNFFALPSGASSFFDFLSDNLRLLSCGVPLGLIKGKDFVPAWQLAFNEAFKADSMPSLDLDYKAALAFLHGESLASVPDDLPKGYVSVTYQNRPLGFIKNIGRRANNLFPDAIRLRLDPSKVLDSDFRRFVIG